MAERLNRSWMLADLIGGISLTGLLIPEGVAYSAIAGLPVAFGITAAIAGPLAYAIIGRSRLAVVSATSGAAALLAAAIGNAAIPNVSRIDCAVALTGLVGLFFLAGAVLRIGALTSFISRAVLHGFGFGLGIIICIRQFPTLVGLPAASGMPWQIIGSIIDHIRQVNLPSLLLGAAALAVLTLARRLKFAAGGLLVIIVSTAAMALGPAGHLAISTVGPIDLSPAMPHVPDLDLRSWAKLAQFAFPIAVVLLAESWATIRTLAAIRGDSISAQREIAALGISNLASAILRGLPVGAGFSIGNANTQAGTADRMGAVCAAITVGLVALTATRWIALIPEPVLAAIVISALSHALSPRPFVSLFRLDKDQWIAVSAAAAVLLLGLINGLLAAVALSVLSLLRRLASPHLSELGRTGPHDFVDCAMHPDAKPVAGLLVVRPDAPLFFGNVDAILGAIAQRVSESGASTIIVSLEETNDLDSSVVEALTEFLQAIEAQKQKLILARVHDPVQRMLMRGGLTGLATSATFSVDDAVQAATGAPPKSGEQGGSSHGDQS